MTKWRSPDGGPIPLDPGLGAVASHVPLQEPAGKASTIGSLEIGDEWHRVAECAFTDSASLFRHGHRTVICRVGSPVFSLQSPALNPRSRVGCVQVPIIDCMGIDLTPPPSRSLAYLSQPHPSRPFGRAILNHTRSHHLCFCLCKGFVNPIR